ncbi:MAG TPA: protein kinase [Kofleriaceae bacterium]|jgi:serine/threonine protein kinase|nr:protein kinase [Kofleriaceae bacterium]
MLTAKPAGPVTATDTTRPRNDLTGRMFGSYRAVRRIGEGGMGQVWLAQADRLGGKLAAVKVLSRDSDEDPDLLQRFWQEVYTIGMTQDDNVVQVFEAGELEDGRQYMVMEYCSGGSLAGYIAKRTKPMELDLVFSIIVQPASALAAAHKIGIIHRDFKPANIMLILRTDGFIRAKLADFGIAKLLTARLDMAIRTGSKKIVGSLGYLAPEQVRSPRDLDHRVDIYALGTTLYECLTGRRPYLAESLHERLVQLAGNEPFPRPKDLRSDIPDALDNAVMGCLEHDRGKRIQSVEEAIARLSDTVSMGPGLTVYAAARFSSPTPTPATDDTASPGIGLAVQKLVSATGTITRRRNTLRLVAALVLGMFMGGVGVGLAWWWKLGPSLNEASATAPELAAAPPGAAQVEPKSPGVDTRVEASSSSPTVGSSSKPTSKPRDAAPEVAKPSKPHDNASAEAIKPSKTSPLPAPPTASANDGLKPGVTATGELVVSVDPYAEVWLDNKSIGPTPLSIRVRAGQHRLRLVNKDLAIEKSIPVTVSVDKRTRVEESW